MLVLMGFLGLAALERVGRDEQVAGFQNRARTAFYAAEAGIAEGRGSSPRRDVARTATWTPAFHDGGGAAEPRATWRSTTGRAGNLPSYYGDPASRRPDPSS